MRGGGYLLQGGRGTTRPPVSNRGNIRPVLGLIFPPLHLDLGRVPLVVFLQTPVPVGRHHQQ